MEKLICCFSSFCGQPFANWFFWVKKTCLTTQRYVLKRVTTVRPSSQSFRKSGTPRSHFYGDDFSPFSFNFSVSRIYLPLKWFCSETILAAKQNHCMLSHHKSPLDYLSRWFLVCTTLLGFSHIILYQRHESIFSLRLSKQNHFPGNANQSVSPSFKVQPDALYEGLQSLIYDKLQRQMASLDQKKPLSFLTRKPNKILPIFLCPFLKAFIS